MANTKEVRKQIASIKSTQKITAAMEMVAASKIRKTQSEMQLGRPYSEKIKEVISHIATSSSEYSHPFYENREAKKACFIVVSSDKGLCGGLNINLFKNVIQKAAELNNQGVESSFALIGVKAANFFKAVGGNVVANVQKLGDKPDPDMLIGLTKTVLDLHKDNEIDQVYICSNKFVNTMTQQPGVQQLIPLPAIEDDGLTSTHWDYIYEPEAKELLEGLMTRYIESLIYHAVVENNACEQAAKMLAMKNATENAGDLIKELELLYNNVRQAAITQELSEIVGGAAAV
ncbi:F0F1 ATP synthase subunit gamma [Gammaproteobacteria bacterium]|jgi:F-type H+-transporting ATPase subunit gamma|nr:F0F1 ATP synthase subunit gamma [Gammaproteobacteria bacterium]MDA9078796.1 F0F1 ATP synthase subunit gamma [Gammaproteobacteria bacterium]MDA9204015.1 F0F1 ATP synthase subunit gamma [Gammaproteobacteria bacterium]MDA9249163.1 F0F1 ATP synthase subunit gamma [Gammaproteobacteria bacterium]MDA9785820.1 F0F1 ATP synthase subunit gamma [Gammaproteobacteria bacterium]